MIHVTNRAVKTCYQRMQALAETPDKAQRRELLREHFDSMNRYRDGMY